MLTSRARLLNNSSYMIIEGLVKLRELVKSRKSQDMEVYVRQTDPNSYRQVLTEIKAKEIRNLIVDTQPENMHHFLRMVTTVLVNPKSMTFSL